jgi:hypothetical protein
MGEPVRIDDLARKMVHLSGLEVKDDNNPNGDIEIHSNSITFAKFDLLIFKSWNFS